MPKPTRPAAWRPRRTIPWLCGLVAFLIAARKLVDGYGDLGVYLTVASELREGGIDLYRARTESGPWVYPHVVALPFAGLQLFLDDRGIRWLYSGFLGVCVAWILGDLIKLMRPLGGLRAWQWAAFGVLFQRCLAQNLTHGQLSLVVAALVTRGALDLQRSRSVRAGLWLGAATALKVTPGLFVLALLPMRKPKAALTQILTAGTLALLVPWPFLGTAEHARLLLATYHALLGSVADPEHAAIVRYYAGPSIRGTLDYLLQPRPVDPEGHTTNILDVSDGVRTWIKVLWSLGIVGVLTSWFLAARRLAEPMRLAQQSATVLLAMSFFSPLLRVYHLSAAVLAFALFCRGPRRGRDPLWWITSFGLLFAMTLRQKNLLGTALWRALDLGGLLHFSLIGLTVWLALDVRRSHRKA